MNSRAVVRGIAPAEGVVAPTCVMCATILKFNARDKGAKQVVCNVYRDGVWKCVEHFHLDCYDGRHGAALIDDRSSHRGNHW